MEDVDQGLPPSSEPALPPTTSSAPTGSIRVTCNPWTPEEREARSALLVKLFNEAQVEARDRFLAAEAANCTPDHEDSSRPQK